MRESAAQHYNNPPEIWSRSWNIQRHSDTNYIVVFLRLTQSRGTDRGTSNDHHGQKVIFYQIGGLPFKKESFLFSIYLFTPLNLEALRGEKITGGKRQRTADSEGGCQSSSAMWESWPGGGTEQ